MGAQPLMPYVRDIESGKQYELCDRIVTVGSAAECAVRPIPPCPARCAHFLFIKGAYRFQALTDEVDVAVNDRPADGKEPLSNGDRLRIGATMLQYIDRSASPVPAGVKPDTVDELLNMVLMLLRDRDGDITAGLMSAVARLLRCDAARIVGEDSVDNNRHTLVRYPAHTGLDRFSNRAIDWARDAAHTILLLETDWADSPTDNRSLEKNAVSSVLCAPLNNGDRLKGYLYLDRLKKDDCFTEHDRLFCDRLLPLFTELLANSEERRRQAEMIAALQKAQEGGDGGIIHRSERMRSVLSLADRIAPSDAPVLISGETGTGKELIARHIHARSLRAEKPFKAINCGAIPENLIESELFGHEKGAFTGAHARKIGLFEASDNGTVLLDELGEMPPALQVKLLRVLQEGEVVRVGATDAVKVDVRIIAATNRDLREEMDKGRFRQDLFFRLNVLTITVPPLRERSEDILLLAEYLIGNYCGRMGRDRKALSTGAQSALLSHLWPGNVRELENVIQKAVIISPSRKIEKEDLEIVLPQDNREEGPSGRTPTLKVAREAAEKECIRSALRTTRGNVSQTSRLLEIDRKWLLTKMSDYGIDADEYRVKTAME
ncbi:MAG: sigma-54-dependent Fis family transcriptional regulator [Chitinispirillaceae bacterium]|nr:sigma-54-dependent Fis family transcriptional regulator [Chitinispirillaceae bacterium]